MSVEFWIKRSRKIRGALTICPNMTHLRSGMVSAKKSGHRETFEKHKETTKRKRNNIIGLLVVRYLNISHMNCRTLEHSIIRGLWKRMS